MLSFRGWIVCFLMISLFTSNYGDFSCDQIGKQPRKLMKTYFRLKQIVFK